MEQPQKSKDNAYAHRPGGMRQVLLIALPMLASHACETTMIFTDRLFLSRIGPEVMNAAMAGGLTTFMMTTFFFGLTGYSTALVAQYLGSGKKRFCSVVLTQAVIIALIGYPLILACRPLAHKLFEIIGVTPIQLVPQKLYFNILLYAVIATLLRNCLSSFFSGIGKTKIVMIASGAAMAINIGANYILIFGKLGLPALGIRGAAYGTILGVIGAVVILSIAYLRKNKEYAIFESFRFRWQVMRTLLRFGYPAGLEMFLNILAFNAVVLLFHAHSLVTATAATIVFNWDMVSFLPLLGIEVAVTSLVGRYMGAQKPDIAHRSTMSALKLGMMFSACVLVFFVGFPKELVEIFRPHAMSQNFMQAAPIAVYMIRLAALYVMVEAMVVIFIGALRGAGDTLWAMAISISLHWILVPVLFCMLKIMKTSPQQAWGALVAIFLFFSILVYLRYHKGKWRSIQVIKEEVPVAAVVPDTFHESIDL